MTLQEIYNKVKQHLLAQNCQSRGQVGAQCAYRGADGCMCAVGCLIPDDLYDPQMEGHRVIHPLIQRALTRAGVLPEDGGQRDVVTNLLCNLQNLHDCQEAYLWPKNLVAIASDYHLEP